MPVNGTDPLVAARDQELALDKLLDRKDDTVSAPQAHGSSAILDGLRGVFYLRAPSEFHRIDQCGQKVSSRRTDLEVTAIGTEDGIREIVSGTDRCLVVAQVSYSSYW